MSLLLPAVVALPALSAAAEVVSGRRRGRRPGLALAAACASAFALTLVVAGGAVADGAVTATTSAAGVTVGLRADRVGALLLLLVLGVGAVVAEFARRQLAVDPRAGWFSASAGALVASTAALVVAPTLLTTAVAWTASGAALVAALATWPAVPGARDGVRRAVRAFAVGDGALWLAVGVASWRWGDVAWAGLPTLAKGARDGDAVVLGVVGGLLVVAAAARSAQVPFQR